MGALARAARRQVLDRSLLPQTEAVPDAMRGAEPPAAAQPKTLALPVGSMLRTLSYAGLP